VGGLASEMVSGAREAGIVARVSSKVLTTAAAAALKEVRAGAT